MAEKLVACDLGVSQLERAAMGAALSGHAIGGASGALVASAHIALLATVFLAATLFGAGVLIDIRSRCLRVSNIVLLSSGMWFPPRYP
jgi:hypothetical protein